MYSKDEPVARSSQDAQQLNDLAALGISLPEDHEDNVKPDEINPEFKAHTSFHKNYDHIGHDSLPISQDASRVGFLRGQEKSGPFCIEGDWVVLNYQLYSQTDGTMLEDTTSS